MDYYLYNIMKIAAIKGFNNVFDTSNFCRGLKSQKIVGAVIDSLIKKYRFSREELFVVSGTGFIENDDLSNTPSTLIIRDIIKEGILKEQDIVKETNYCIHPEFLKYQLNKSLASMNLKTIDTVFLHYPFESMESLQQKEIKQRLTKAFEFFEEMFSYEISLTLVFKEGLDKKYYGNTQHLPKVLDMANEAGGANNSFKYLKCFHSFNCLEALYHREFKKNKLKYVKSYYNTPTEKRFKRGQYITLLNFCELNKINVLGMIKPLSQTYINYIYDNDSLNIDPFELNEFRSYLGQDSVVSNLLSIDSIEKLNMISSVATMDPLTGTDQMLKSMINFYKYIASNKDIIENSKVGVAIRMKSREGKITDVMKIPMQG